MPAFVMTVPPNFDWESEDGKYMNLMLNLSAGLSKDALSEDERALIARVEARHNNSKG